MRGTTWLLRPSSLAPEERPQCYAVVNRVLELGGGAAWVLKPSSYTSRGKKLRIQAGDFVLSDEKDFPSVKPVCEDLGVSVVRIASSTKVQSVPIRPSVVALYHDFGISGESLVSLVGSLRQLGFWRLIFLTSATLEEKLSGVDVLFLPEGDSTVVTQGLGVSGAETIRSFVASGGCCVAICESATLVASPSPDRVVGPQDEEFQGPAEVLRMVRCDTLNEFSDLPAPSSSFSRFETKVRIRPFEGEIVLRVRKPSHPLMFGYKRLLNVHSDGPVFSGTIGSDTLCTFHKPTEKTTHHLPKDLAWRLAAERPAIITSSFQGGKIIMVGAHIENPSTPSTWPLVGNMVFYSLSASPPTRSEEILSVPREDPFRLLDSVLHRSLAFQRAISPLELEMEMLRPRLHAILDPQAVKAWASSSRAVPELIKSTVGLFGSCSESACIYLRARSLRDSIESLAGSKEELKEHQTDLTDLSRAEADLLSVLSTASRALKILRGMAEQTRKNLTEVASLAELEATMKPDVATIKTLRCSALTVVAALVGGSPFHSPWYHGESGPCVNTWLVKGQEGLVAPVLGLASALERANLRLSSAIARGLG